MDIVDGDYDALGGAGVVMITSGINEKAEGATDRGDPQGRLRLLDKNAAIYRDIVPRIVRATSEAVLLVVTDPPDPLAEAAAGVGIQQRVLSTGTPRPAPDRNRNIVPVGGTKTHRVEKRLGA